MSTDIHPSVVLQSLSLKHSAHSNAASVCMTSVDNDIQSKTADFGNRENTGKKVHANKKAPKREILVGEQKKEIKGQMKMTEGRPFPKTSGNKNTRADVADDSLTEVEPDSDSHNTTVAVTNVESKKRIDRAPKQAHGEQKKKMKTQLKNTDKKKQSMPVADESKKRIDRAPAQAHGEQKKKVKRELKNTDKKKQSMPVTDDSITPVKPKSVSESKTLATIKTESKKMVKVNDIPAETVGDQNKGMKKHSKNTDKEKIFGESNCSDKNGSVSDGRTKSKQGNMDKSWMTDGSVSGFLADPAEQSPGKSKTLTEVNGLQKKGEGGLAKSEVGLAKAGNENPETVWSGTEKKQSSNENGKGMEAAAGSSVFPASMKKDEYRKRKLSISEQACEHGSEHDWGNQCDASGEANTDVAFKPSPTKAQKTRELGSGRSEIDGVENTTVKVTSCEAGLVPQPLMSSSQPGRIRQCGRPASRRLYSNVGNRVLSADTQPVVPGGNGLPVLRGRGRGRRGTGTVPLAGVRRGRGIAAGPYGARSGALAPRVLQRGMPVRGHGRVHIGGGPPLLHPQNQMDAFSAGYLPGTPLVNDASATANDPALNFTTASARECLTTCCVIPRKLSLCTRI